MGGEGKWWGRGREGEGCLKVNCEAYMWSCGRAISFSSEDSRREVVVMDDAGRQEASPGRAALGLPWAAPCPRVEQSNGWTLCGL